MWRACSRPSGGRVLDGCSTPRRCHPSRHPDRVFRVTARRPTPSDSRAESDAPDRSTPSRHTGSGPAGCPGVSASSDDLGHGRQFRLDAGGCRGRGAGGVLDLFARARAPTSRHPPPRSPSRGLPGRGIAGCRPGGRCSRRWHEGSPGQERLTPPGRPPVSCSPPSTGRPSGRSSRRPIRPNSSATWAPSMASTGTQGRRTRSPPTRRPCRRPVSGR